MSAAQKIEIAADDLAPRQVLQLATEMGYAHVLQKNGLEYDKELASTTALKRDPQSFFRDPVASVLNLANAMTVECDFNRSSQKREVLDSVIRSLQANNLPQSLVDDITLVADELFTNAVFNAPFVDKVTHLNPGVSRFAQEVVLEEGKYGKLTLAFDPTRVLVVCKDPYGSLNLYNFLTKIQATYERGAAATINFGAGGAGLGSYIIFNTSASLFVGVKTGCETVLAGLFPIRMSNRKRAFLPKHLHLIQL